MSTTTRNWIGVLVLWNLLATTYFFNNDMSAYEARVKMAKHITASHKNIDINMTTAFENHTSLVDSYNEHVH